jgi:hypothetical protein
VDQISPSMWCDPVYANTDAASGVVDRARTTGSCTSVLSDGRRFRCSLRFAQRLAPGRTPASVFEHSKACTQLATLVVPARLQVVAARIGKARACLAAHRLRVFGGLAFPAGRGAGYAPAGELDLSPRDIGSSGRPPIHGLSLLGAALIAFYSGVQDAEISAPHVIKNVKRGGGQFERAGTQSIVWLTAPPHSVRDVVEACI